MADVLSPVPGIFYSAPSPDKPPFVQVGDKVEAGQTIGIVEIMKQFTEIKTEVSGTISAINVENKQPVTPGAVLVVVDEG